MKVKDLLQVLLKADPEAVLVNFYPDKKSCMPIEEIMIGSLCVKPQWATGGQMIIDGGDLANDENVKIFMKMKDVAVFPAICFK